MAALQAMPFRGEMIDEKLWEGPATEQALASFHSCPALLSSCVAWEIRLQGSLAHLFQWQLPEQRQRAGEQPNEEGRGRAHYVDHGGWQHRDVGVLPAEGVDESYHGVAAFGQSAAGGTDREKRLSQCGWGQGFNSQG